MICNDVRVLALEIAPDFWASRIATRPLVIFIVEDVIHHKRASWAQSVLRVRCTISDVYLHIIQALRLIFYSSGDHNGVLEIWAIKSDSENH